METSRKKKILKGYKINGYRNNNNNGNNKNVNINKNTFH